MIALSFLASLALAAEPAPMTLEVPALGVTLVASNGGCDFTVVGTVPARKAGEIAKAAASAKSECLTAEARIDAETSRNAAAVARAPGESKLIGDAGTALVIGRNVEVVTPEGLTVRGGEHLNWKAYGEAVTAADPRTAYSGYIDPNLVGLGRLAGVPMGHPVTPGTSGGQQVVATAPATAACGTAEQCQQTIDAQARAMAASDE